MLWSITLLISCLLTWLEIDQTLSVPDGVKRRGFIRTCVWSFIGINGLLSIGLYCLLIENPVFSDLDPLFKAVIIGLAYPALVRIKFTTLKISDREVSVGLDMLYESIKNSLYKRVRRIVRDAEFDAVQTYAEKESFEHLLKRALFEIERDMTKSSLQKESDINWCRNIESDKKASEATKKEYLAGFILFGRARR